MANYTRNERGEYVAAVGAPGSIARLMVEYPVTISYLRGLHLNTAIWMVKGMKKISPLEMKNLLVASEHAEDTLDAEHKISQYRNGDECGAKKVIDI